MSEGIAYQNKDITSKIFAEKFVGKSLEVYGIHLPKIKEVLPTNLPVIQANELRLDNLFLLENNSLVLIDYESTYDGEDKLKYLDYVVRIAKKYYKVYRDKLKIEIVIIYTADVTEQQTENVFDLGSVTLKVHPAFLSALDSSKIQENLVQKVKQGKPLSDNELMQFIILPLTYRGAEKKNEAIQELFELSKEIEENTQLFLLSGILVFTDKVINEETAKRIKEWISMTKVARLFEEEKQEAVKAEQKKGAEALKAEKRKTVERLLKKETDMEVIQYVTDLTKEEIKKIQKELCVPD